MVDTIKFSQMTDGGDIDNNKKTPGLKSGDNVLFNNPWTFLPPGSTAQRPTPSAEVNYRLRFNTDDQLYEYYDAILGAWTQLQESMFTQGPFIIYKADASIPDGQNLGALANGILKQTIALGVATLDIAVNGTDYWKPGDALTRTQAPVAGSDVTNKTYVDSLVAGGVLSIQGTANQVLVNSTSGSPQLGAIVLTTPQDIGLTSSPTFSNLQLTGGIIVGSDGTTVYELVNTALSVNYIRATSQVTGVNPTLSAQGSNTNIGLSLVTKGTGAFSLISAALTQPLIIYNGTSNQHITRFNMANTAQDRSVTWPDASGTVAFTSDLGAYLPLVGGTMSGVIAMGNNKITGLATPTLATDAATKAYADLMLPLAGGTMGGNISLASAYRVTNALDPVSPQDYATKFYVDQNALNGTSVYAATAATLGTVTQSGAGVGATLTNAGAQAVFTIDGVSPPLNSQVLIKNTATGMTAANEGIYTVTNVGSVSTNWVLTRATSYDTPSEINNTGLIVIQNGSTLAGTLWYNTTTIVTVDTTSFSYSQFGNQYALKGANADITSMSGLTGALQAPTAISSSAGLPCIGFIYNTSAVSHLDFYNAASASGTGGPGIVVNSTDASSAFGLNPKNAAVWISDISNTIGAAIRFYNANDSQYTELKVAAASAATLSLTLPSVDGSNGMVWQTNGSGVTSFVYQNLIQSVSGNATVVAGTTVVPFDNSPPQNGEGLACGSLSITPKSATSTLEIEAFVCANCAGSAQSYVLSVFQDANVSALRSSFGLAPANAGMVMYIKHRMTSGTTSSTTFSFRCGGNSAGSAVSIGSYNAGAILNGLGIGLITIKELNA